MNQPTYLEFVELDDYCAHLAAHDRNETRLEISVSTGKPSRGKIQVLPVTIYAVATCRITEADESHIACWAQVILATNTLNAQMERDLPEDQRQGRQAMFKNFERTREELEKRGFRVERGKWSLTTPDFLK